MTIVAFVLILLAVVTGAIGVLGLAQRLPRNRYAGVRTEASLRSAETFRLANRVAGVPLAAAAVIGAVAGLAAVFAEETAAKVVLVAVGLVGLVAITVAAGALGNRAAATLPQAEPAGCAGCQCGGCALSASAE